MVVGLKEDFPQRVCPAGADTDLVRREVAIICSIDGNFARF
jgi:hypothetical protein